MTVQTGEAMATRQLAEFVATASYESLPPEVVEQTKLLLLDAFACQLGGYQSELGGIAVDLALAEGSAPQATLVGAGRRVSVSAAASANARLGATLDADDTFNCVSHHGNPLVAVAVALAEELGRSGRDLIAAVALGFDIGARVGASTGPPKLTSHAAETRAARMGSGPVPYLAGAAAAGRLLGLTPDQLAHAFGIASLYVPLPPTKWLEVDVLPLMKAADAGWQALGGLTAARLAERGATGFTTILDGPHGLWRMQGADHCDYDLMLDRIGTKWFILDTTFKRWPCQRWMHYSLTAFEQLRQQETFRADEIERVVVIPNGRSASPRFAVQQPTDATGAQFSYPHAVAMVALDVTPGPLWFTSDALHGPVVRALRDRVVIEPPAERRAEDPSWFAEGQIRRLPSGIRVTARGKTLERFVEYALGDPWNPDTRFDESDLIGKLKAFATPLAGADPRWSRQLDRLVETIRSLEQLEDVRTLGDLLGR